MNTRKSLRKFVELTLPALARELKLGVKWDYKELYLGILEASAKICRIPKYQIYTLEEIENSLQQRKDRIEEYGKLPGFAQLILNQQEDEENEPERT